MKFENAVYVMHAFQKILPKGVKTSHTDVELISRRFRAASERGAIWQAEEIMRFFGDSLNESFSLLISPLPEFKNAFQIYPPVGPRPMEREFFIIEESDKRLA